MIVYIKDKKDFRTKTTAVAVEWEIHESIYDAKSTVTIPTSQSSINEGDYVLFDGDPYVGIVTEVDIDGGKTELSVEQGVTLFSREMFYTSSSYTYLEDYLESLIDTNFANCSDSMYKIPFLSVNALTHTSGSMKPDLEDNVYSVTSFISKLRRLKDIVCEWSFDTDNLYLSIFKKTFPTHNIDLSNPRFRVTEQTISNQAVGKLTIYCEENGNTYTRYLKTDGTITGTKPADADRVEGEWQTLTILEYADLNDDVQDAFAQNYYSHRISFETERDFNLYDRLNIRMDGKIFASYVSGIIRDKSNFKTIECGELQTLYPYLKRL